MTPLIDELRRQSGINGDTDIRWKAADELESTYKREQECRMALAYIQIADSVPDHIKKIATTALGE